MLYLHFFKNYDFNVRNGSKYNVLGSTTLIPWGKKCEKCILTSASGTLGLGLPSLTDMASPGTAIV